MWRSIPMACSSPACARTRRVPAAVELADGTACDRSGDVAATFAGPTFGGSTPVWLLWRRPIQKITRARSRCRARAIARGADRHEIRLACGDGETAGSATALAGYVTLQGAAPTGVISSLTFDGRPQLARLIVAEGRPAAGSGRRYARALVAGSRSRSGRPPSRRRAPDAPRPAPRGGRGSRDRARAGRRPGTAARCALAWLMPPLPIRPPRWVRGRCGGGPCSPSCRQRSVTELPHRNQKCQSSKTNSPFLFNLATSVVSCRRTEEHRIAVRATSRRSLRESDSSPWQTPLSAARDARAEPGGRQCHTMFNGC